MILDLNLQLVGAWFVVFKAVYAASPRLALPLLRDAYCIFLVPVCLGLSRNVLHPRVAIIDCSYRCMRKASTSCASFNDMVARPCAQSLQDVAVIGRVHHLGSVR